MYKAFSVSRIFFSILLMLFCKSLFASGFPKYPFDVNANISPDKRYYEEGDIVTISGTIVYDKNDPDYSPNDVFDIISDNIVGDYDGNIIISSTFNEPIRVDSTFNQVQFSVVYEVKQLSKNIYVNIKIYRNRFNYNYEQQLIEKGLDPNNPEFEWDLYHKKYRDLRVIRNTNPYIPKHLRKKRY